MILLGYSSSTTNMPQIEVFHTYNMIVVVVVVVDDVAHPNIMSCHVMQGKIEVMNHPSRVGVKEKKDCGEEVQ